MRRLVPWIVWAVCLVAGWACAPEFVVAVFSYARHPDFPRGKYLDGDLGVFLPTYARSYLVIAYRHMTGAGFDAREREQVLDYWKDRASGDWDRTAADWMERWRAAREHLASVPAPPRKKLLTEGVHSYSTQTNSFALNCADDAFRNALHTLEARQAQFGGNSRAVREWVKAQDQVFANCDSPKAGIPAPADPDLPAIIRQDREYQIAAANFYAGRHAEARDGFRRIAKDRASPWRTIAPYLVARTLFRMPAESAQEVPAHARRILADATLAPIHGMTWALLRRAQIEIDDREYFHELSQQLSSKGQGNGLREELWAFTTIFDHLTGVDPWENIRGKQPSDLAIFQRDDLADWILIYQGLRPESALYAYAKWKSVRSLPWLIAALAQSPARGQHAEELIDAAAAVPRTSPAFLTVAYHRSRLRMEQDAKPDVRQELDTLLSQPMPKSAVNLFRGLRMRATPDLAGFLRFAVRRPVMLTLSSNKGETPLWPSRDEWASKLLAPFEGGSPRLDRDSARTLNVRTPLRRLAEAAKSEILPANLRREFAITALTRALLLHEDAITSDMIRALRSQAPDLRPYIDTYLKGSTDGDRRFAAAILLLHAPEARPFIASGISRQTTPGKIDNYRDNWWCPVTPQGDLDSVANTGEEDGRPAIDPGSAQFLSTADRQRATKEIDALAITGSATDALGRIVVEYAQAHPDDPRLAEALFLVIRGNRYGCDRYDDARQADAALKILRRRYPRSEFTAKGANYYDPWRRRPATPR